MSARSDATIAVVGASGHTGAFVVEELRRRGHVPVAIGRDAARLAARGYAARGVRTCVADPVDPDALDRALDGVTAVINAAGPFLDTATMVSSAALRVGAHYLDVTAEQASARAILDRHQEAQRAGVTLLPAVAFYGGFADLLCTAVAGTWDRIDDVQVVIALDRWHPTAGTRETGRRNTVPRVVMDDGEVVPLTRVPLSTTVDLPAPFGTRAVTEVPFSEVPLLAHHLPIRRLRTWLTDTALDDLRDPATPPPVAVDASGRSSQRFHVEVTVAGSGGRNRASVRGRDIYGVSADLVVAATGQLLHRGADVPGAYAPGAILDARALLTDLRSDVFDVEHGERHVPTA